MKYSFKHTSIITLLTLLFPHAVYSQVKSWLACPPSFDMSLGRAGNGNAPCEDVDPSMLTGYSVNAGDRIKVGWPSGNRGGGFVRLALVSQAEMSETAFNEHVLKQTCFGYDSRPGRFAFGNCVHPCNARGGCEFQRDASDSQRYDTTIAIPTNLKDGDYILQFMAYIANSQTPVYSCSKLKISGGNPSQSCSRPPFIPGVSDCVKANGPDASVLTNNAQAGQFCYNFN